MAVTEEDGGRLNLFASEPRMTYAEPASAGSNAKRLMMIGMGGVVVLAMMAVAVRIS